MRTRTTSLTVSAGTAATLLAILMATSGCSAGGAQSGEAAAAGAGGGKVNTAAPLYAELPADIKKKGAIDVGADIEFPPFEFYAGDGKTVTGVSRAWMDAVEKQVGVPINFTNVAFDSIIPGLAAKRFDMSMSMGDFKVREKSVDFLDTFYGGGAILVPKSNSHKVKTIGDLCGLNVAIQTGTSVLADATAQNQRCQAEGKAPMVLSNLPSLNNVLLALQTGRADAALVDYSSTSYLVKTQGAELTTLPPYQKVKLGIAFPKGSALAQIIQRAMTKARSDGTYLDVLNKYGEKDAALDAFTINGALS